MPTQLHILNASGQFDTIRERIETCFAKSMKDIESLLGIGSVDVVVSSNPQSVIPELGIGGHSPSGNLVFLAVAPDHPNVLKGFESAFRHLLAHELHHCARWSGPGYGQTLAEAMISEGLACMFEAEICEGEIPFYAQALSSEQVAQLLSRAESELHNKTYNHAAWFFGDAAKNIPRHAGYSIGYDLVSRIISTHGGSAAQFALSSAQDLYAHT